MLTWFVLLLFFAELGFTALLQQLSAWWMTILLICESLKFWANASPAVARSEMNTAAQGTALPGMFTPLMEIDCMRLVLLLAAALFSVLIMVERDSEFVIFCVDLVFKTKIGKMVSGKMPAVCCRRASGFWR